MIYIYETPFEGITTATMSDNLTVDYTGPQTRTETKTGVKIEFLNKLTFLEYCEQNGKKFETATGLEIDKMFFDHENKNVISEFKEISADRFNEMLNVLPPAKWTKYDGLETFFVPECYTSNIYGFYLHDKINKKYFHALRRISDNYDTLRKSYFEQIKK